MRHALALRARPAGAARPAGRQWALIRYQLFRKGFQIDELAHGTSEVTCTLAALSAGPTGCVDRVVARNRKKAMLTSYRAHLRTAQQMKRARELRGMLSARVQAHASVANSAMSGADAGASSVRARRLVVDGYY